MITLTAEQIEAGRKAVAARDREAADIADVQFDCASAKYARRLVISQQEPAFVSVW